MHNCLASIVAASCIVFSFLDTPAVAQVASEPDSRTEQNLPISTPTQSALEEMRSDLKELQSELLAREEAQEIVVRYLQIGVAWIALVSLLALALQFVAFRVDSTIRRRSQDENEANRTREESLNERLIRVLDVTTKSAEQAQQQLSALQEGGIRRAAETLQLINNLLTITERSAAKAADAHYEFLSSSIENVDGECQNLNSEAIESDERDIIAKPVFIERVKILAKQIDSLDNQILAFNQSAPRQLAPSSEETQSGKPFLSELSLTGPCLFIRGLEHHVQQNFEAAIEAWKTALKANNSSAIAIDANYWAGYVNNTLGRFSDAMSHIRAASELAPVQRKPELVRLLLETRFFALKDKDVPEELLKEGGEYFNELDVSEISSRAISSFATTMGNMCMIQQVRTSGKKPNFKESTDWFDRALQATDRSRWARFGKYQNKVLLSKRLSAKDIEDIKDIIGSVRREYQNREEDRSKALSKITEYMCMLMVGSYNNEDLSTISGLVELHTGKVSARTLYSQFRKQNITKNEFLDEFHYLRESKDFRAVFYKANGVQ